MSSLYFLDLDLVLVRALAKFIRVSGIHTLFIVVQDSKNFKRGLEDE